MKRHRYLLDPVCVLAIAAYLLGRFGLREWVPAGFWHDQFTDLWLIPAALPLLLGVQRTAGLRPHDAPPTWREIGLHLAVWSVAAEWLAPHFFAHCTGDWRDVAAYAAGAALAGGWWNLA